MHVFLCSTLFFIFLFMIKEKCANTQKLRSRRIEKLSSSYVPSIKILNYKKLFIPAQKYSITRFLQLSYIRRLEHFPPQNWNLKVRKL